MAIECPACESENVQSIKAIIEGGTTRSTGYYSGSVTGISSSGNLGGGFTSGTTSSTSKTDLARSLEEFLYAGMPQKPKKAVLVLLTFGILIGLSVPLSLVGAAIGSFMDPSTNCAHNVCESTNLMAILLWLVTQIPFLLIGLASAIGLKKWFAKKKIYIDEYPKWEKWSSERYNNYFYCHKCGNKFSQ